MANRILKDIEWEQRVRDKIGVDDYLLILPLGSQTLLMLPKRISLSRYQTMPI